ncbi:MAG: hypothetical protein WC796_04455 [Candidatus Pacearchaeota archaeon]|jgi:hypothetical protein
MKKWLIILLICLVLVIIIASGYLIKTKLDERREHTFEYKFIGCSVQCPIVPHERNNSILVFEPTCWNKCGEGLYTPTKSDAKYITKYWMDCNNLWATNPGNYTKLKECWIEILPKIKQDYPYVDQ